MTDDLVKWLRAMARGEHDDLSLGDDAADRIVAQEAEIARLRKLLAEADRRIVWESHGFGSDFAEGVEAAIAMILEARQ